MTETLHDILPLIQGRPLMYDRAIAGVHFDSRVARTFEHGLSYQKYQMVYGSSLC